MDLRFLEVILIGKDGQAGTPYWVRPDKVVGVAIVLVPGTLAGPTGDPVFTQKAGLDLGDKMIVVDKKPEDMVEILENFYH